MKIKKRVTRLKRGELNVKKWRITRLVSRELRD